MKPSSQVRQTLSRLWKKRFIWIGLSCCVLSAYALFSWRQGMEEAALSVAGNIIASAIVGIALLLFWDKLLRKTTFFPSDEVTFLNRRCLSRKELADYEHKRYTELLDKIKKILADHPTNQLFSFILMGPEQSGKSSFSRFVNSEPRCRREYLALEVPYAAIADNPNALDEVFHWLCEGDERERIRCRIIVFHAGNSVTQVNELVGKLEIIQKRFRKIGEDGEDPVRHRILLMVQFTGRRPLEAISSDFNWDEVLDGMLPLNYISPDWLLEKCQEQGFDENLARHLYLHTLGIPDWYNTLAKSRNPDELFQARWQYLERWFPNADKNVLPETFWSKDVVQARCPDSLPFRFLANTYLLENVCLEKSKLADALNHFLEEELPAMDIASGRKTVRLIGQKFFVPLSEAFLLYHGFLPTLIRTDEDKEKKPIRIVLPEVVNTILAWPDTEETNGVYLRRRLAMEFFVSIFRYISTCNVRIESNTGDNPENTMENIEKRLLECFHAVIDEKDSGYADMALVLSLVTRQHGQIVTDLENLAHPNMVKLTRVLRQGKDEKWGSKEWAQRFLEFASLCDDLYPDRLPQMVETLFFLAGNKLYQESVDSNAGTKLHQESVPAFSQKQNDAKVFHRLEQCIQAYRRLVCRSQDVYLINKLVELDTLRLAFARPTGYAGVVKIVQEELTEKYAFFYDSKDFLECRSWLRKTLCTVQIADKEWSGRDMFELPEYDKRWETVIHKSELWMANHAAQQAFLLSKYNHAHPSRTTQASRISRNYQKLILDDLIGRLRWYREFTETSSASVPKRNRNELLFAQINFLTYRDLSSSKTPGSDWKGLALNCSDDELAKLAVFCENGILEMQKKLWEPLPTDPKERQWLTSSSCRLARLLFTAFHRGLLDKNPRLFVNPLSVGVGKVEDTVLFQGQFSDRDTIVEETKRILRARGQLSEEVCQWLEAPKAESAGKNT